MNKKILAILLILLCGCTIKFVDTSSVNGIINSILFKDDSIVNSHFTGFSMYIPQGATILDTSGFTLKIKDSNNKYYMYIDPIAYNFNVKNKYVVNKDSFYSNTFNYKEYEGYIDIKEVDNKYFVVMMYNYAKIEAYVNKDNINTSIINMCYLLSNVKFNDSYIKDYIGNKGNVYQEEDFDIFSSKKEKNNFLTYEKEHGTIDD